MTRLAMRRVNTMRGLWLRVSVAILLVASVIACRGGERVALPSGGHVTVLAVSSESGERGPILAIDYASGGPSTQDHIALLNEAEQVWAVYRDRPEATSATVALLKAHIDGSARRVVPFRFPRASDGTWRTPEVLALPQGKKLLVVSVEKRDGGLYVDYVTEHSIKDHCALATEVFEVWAQYRAIAEQAGITKAFIMPNDAPVGGSLIAYSFSREAGGDWSRRGVCVEPHQAP